MLMPVQPTAAVYETAVPGAEANVTEPPLSAPLSALQCRPHAYSRQSRGSSMTIRLARE